MNLEDQLDYAIRSEDIQTVETLLSQHSELVNGLDDVITPPLSIAVGVTRRRNVTVTGCRPGTGLMGHGCDSSQIRDHLYTSARP